MGLRSFCSSGQNILRKFTTPPKLIDPLGVFGGCSCCMASNLLLNGFTHTLLFSINISFHMYCRLVWIICTSWVIFSIHSLIKLSNVFQFVCMRFFWWCKQYKIIHNCFSVFLTLETIQDHIDIWLPYGWWNVQTHWHSLI